MTATKSVCPMATKPLTTFQGAVRKSRKPLAPRYDYIHAWMRKNFGKADHCENPQCKGKSTAFSWALIKGKEYAMKRENFRQMCRVCHSRYDLDTDTRTSCRKGHDLTPENTVREMGYRRCRECKRERDRKRRGHKAATPGFCKAGHDLKVVGTYSWPARPQVRMCMGCRRIREDALNAQRRAERKRIAELKQETKQ